MLVLNFASSALVAQSVYYYLVPHFGSLLPLNSITDELSAECLISTIITFISQAYFVVQLYGVARTKSVKGVILVPISVAVCAILAFAGGVGCTTIMVVNKHNVLDDRSTPFNIFFGLAKGFGALTDIVATIAMCIMLASSKTGMSNTNSLINRLMQYIMHRGVLVTLIQTLLLITFHAAPTRLYWLAFHVNVTKLYANTFFSMLNGRQSLKRGASINSSLGMSGARKSRTNPIRSALQFSRSTSQSEDLEMELTGRYGDNKGFAVAPMPTVTKTVVIREL